VQQNDKIVGKKCGREFLEIFEQNYLNSKKSKEPVNGIELQANSKSCKFEQYFKMIKSAFVSLYI